MILPQEYIIQKFYQHAGYPKFKKISNTYEAGCPICREGSSWGKKRRSYYLVEKNAICCHNCGWYSKPLKWIQEVSGMSMDEIFSESKNFDILPLDVLQEDNIQPKPKETDKLPKDSINLFDSQQVDYYKDEKVVQEAVKVIKDRKLDTAINRPPTLWISLSDKVHKNRLVIPFYNQNNEIVFYQTRTVLKNDLKLYPKYLSKVNSEKALYGLNKITHDVDSIFITEGPIDAFFLKNGTAVCGIQDNSSNMFTKFQEEQLASFKLFNRIWVLDSQWQDIASRKKTKKLIELGETVFIWPEKMGRNFKDINEYCVIKNLDFIDTRFIQEHSFSGIKAELLMVEINRYLR